MYVCMHACMYVCMYVCMYACIYLSICLTIYLCVFPIISLATLDYQTVATKRKPRKCPVDIPILLALMPGKSIIWQFWEHAIFTERVCPKISYSNI